MNILLGKDENFLGIENKPDWPGNAGALILPVPFEQSSSYGIGSSAGPQAIIEASQQVELFDTGLGIASVDVIGGIATLPYLVTDDCDAAAQNQRLKETVAPWLAKEKFVVTIGGEHTSVVGAIEAYSERYEGLTVLQLDAHSDLRESYQDNSWSHACAMARVRDFNQNLVQVGIRSECEEEAERVHRENIPVFYAEKIHAQERKDVDWIGDVIAATAHQVYVTFDCDVFDPSVIPATGTPEPAGLDWMQIDCLFKRLAKEREIVGFDVSELAPIVGLHHSQFTIAKLIYRLLGYISKNKF